MLFSLWAVVDQWQKPPFQPYFWKCQFIPTYACKMWRCGKGSADRRNTINSSRRMWGKNSRGGCERFAPSKVDDSVTTADIMWHRVPQLRHSIPLMMESTYFDHIIELYSRSKRSPFFYFLFLGCYKPIGLVNVYSALLCFAHSSQAELSYAQPALPRSCAINSPYEIFFDEPVWKFRKHMAWLVGKRTARLDACLMLRRE